MILFYALFYDSHHATFCWNQNLRDYLQFLKTILWQKIRERTLFLRWCNSPITNTEQDISVNHANKVKTIWKKNLKNQWKFNKGALLKLYSSLDVKCFAWPSAMNDFGAQWMILEWEWIGEFLLLYLLSVVSKVGEGFACVFSFNAVLIITGTFFKMTLYSERSDLPRCWRFRDTSK